LDGGYLNREQVSFYRDSFKAQMGGIWQ
jgi:hypothetical protein